MTHLVQAVVEDLGTGVYTAAYSSNISGPLSVRRPRPVRQRRR
jgi:hypothetical protein